MEYLRTNPIWGDSVRQITAIYQGFLPRWGLVGSDVEFHGLVRAIEDLLPTVVGGWYVP
jgi:hypothetical protein